jgi:acyl-CoA synthetase (NDP forming)
MKFVVALGVLVAFGAALGYLFRLAPQAPELLWERYIYLYGGVEAVGFAAAGFLFGREVNRQRAENAEKTADKKTEEAATAREGTAAANAKGQALRSAISAKLAAPAKVRILEALGTDRAEHVQNFVHSDLEDLDVQARTLFPG